MVCFSCDTYTCTRHVILALVLQTVRLRSTSGLSTIRRPFFNSTSIFEIKDTTDTVKSASYLDLHLEIDNEGRLKTKLYDKRDDFSFPIVNFPFLSSNIPAAPAYGVYISQLIRYSRACISYHDFLDRGLLLTRKLLNQEFQMVKLKSSLRKFYGRHHELVDRYGITVSQMISDMFLTS